MCFGLLSNEQIQNFPWIEQLVLLEKQDLDEYLSLHPWNNQLLTVWHNFHQVCFKYVFWSHIFCEFCPIGKRITISLQFNIPKCLRIYVRYLSWDKWMEWFMTFLFTWIWKQTSMGPILIISNALEKSIWMPCKNCWSSFRRCIESST